MGNVLCCCCGPPTHRRWAADNAGRYTTLDTTVAENTPPLQQKAPYGETTRLLQPTSPIRTDLDTMRRENMRSDVDELALDVAASIEAMGCEDDAAFALLPAGIEEYSDEHVEHLKGLTYKLMEREHNNENLNDLLDDDDDAYKAKIALFRQHCKSTRRWWAPSTW